MKTVSIKELLTKLTKRTTFSIITASSGSRSFPANTGTWLTITPTLTGNQKIVALTGWYLYGIATTYLYNYRISDSGTSVSVAIQNPATSAKTGRVDVDLLIVEE